MSAGLILSGIGAGLGGLSQLLESMGVFKNPAIAAEEKRREEMRKYLEANMPELNYQEQKFDPAKFSDVLNPMAERQGTQEQGFGNAIGLRGLGRSGVGAEMVLQNQRRNTGDMGNMYAKLNREQNSDDYRRAMQKYQADLQKAQIMAGVQG